MSYYLGKLDEQEREDLFASPLEMELYLRDALDAMRRQQIRLGGGRQMKLACEDLESAILRLKAVVGEDDRWMSNWPL